jgi:hypothetical protein
VDAENRNYDTRKQRKEQKRVKEIDRGGRGIIAAEK